MSFYEVCLFVCVGVCVWEEYVCIVFLYLVSGSVFRLRSEQDAINPRTHTQVFKDVHVQGCALWRWWQITAAERKFPPTWPETHTGQEKYRQTGGT